MPVPAVSLPRSFFAVILHFGLAQQPLPLLAEEQSGVEGKDLWCSELTDGAELRDTASELGRTADCSGSRLCSERAVHLDPTDGEAWALLSEALLCLGKHAAAVLAAQRSIDILPTAQAHYLKGTAHLANRSAVEAGEALQSAVALDGTMLPALVNLAAALMRQRNYPDAMGVYEHALSIAPQNHALLVGLAVCHSALQVRMFHRTFHRTFH